MRKTLIILFLFSSVVVNATTYYVATNGSNNNPGSITQPFATWNYACGKLKAGDILYVRGGTYKGVIGVSGGNAFGVRIENVNGTSGSHITVSAYNGEVPILDGSSCTLTTGSNVGMILNNCSYWDFIGLTVTNFTQHSVNAYSAPGWVESNCSHINHTFCTVHECGDGFTLWGTKDYIYYKNCDSYQNCDHMNDEGGEGGLANGFASGLDKGEHVFYEGCRAWQNSDDGWDCFNGSGGSGYIQYLNCWAFNNGAYGGVSGDGAGFKLGVTVSSADGGIQRTLKNCVAVSNALFGYDQNDGGYGTLIPMSVINCISYQNKNSGFNFRNGTASIIRNCVSIGETVGNFGSNTVDHNSWQNGLTATSADFVSIDLNELSRPRKADGSLPDINLLHLVTGSHLVDAGIDVGIPYSGKAPDLGAFELQVGSSNPIPAFISAVVENATPSILELTYDLNLSNLKVPAVTSFSVMVNSLPRSVSSVAISGNKVQLTLGSAIKFGDIIAFSYTKPSTNPLQTASGAQVVSISNKSVTNNCKDISKANDPPVVVLNYPQTAYAGFVNKIDASTTYDPNNDPLNIEWTVPDDVPFSTLKSLKTEFLAPIVESSTSVNLEIKVSDGINIIQNDISITVLPYKPELSAARITGIEASDFQTIDYPNNVLDNNTSTKWSANGDNQWLLLKLSDPFKISHLVLAFLIGQDYKSFFDIYASKDNVIWDHILTSAASCKFSGERQVFDFPALYTNTEYSYLKYVGHGNSTNFLNSVSEFKIYGSSQQNSNPESVKNNKVLIYPNPARDFFNISIEESAMNPDLVRIIDATGKIVVEYSFYQGMNKVQIPDSLYSGIYIVELRSGTITLNAQKLIIDRESGF